MRKAVRIGIVGTESSHVDHIIDYLNAAAARPGIRVTALAGTADERAQALCRAGGIDLVVPDVPALLDVADVLIVTARHGGRHRELALPFMEAGRPVLVDKPFACAVADAEAMLDAAAKHATLVTSFSAVRYLPETDALAAELAAIGPARSVVATGPADEASEYGGIFFYGIHPVDVALRLAPGPLRDIRTDRVGESVVASALAGDARVTVNLVKPAPEGPGHSGAQWPLVSFPGRFPGLIAVVLLPVRLAGTPPAIECKSVSMNSKYWISAPGPLVQPAPPPDGANSARS
jgi:predicted dehydrogenase